MTTQSQQNTAVVESERVILGSIVSGRKKPSSVLEELSVEDFYEKLHQSIFTACVDLEEKGAEIDLPSLFPAVQDASYLGKLAEYYGFGNTNHHIQQIKTKGIQRRLQKVGQEIYNLGNENDKDPIEQLDQAEELLTRVSLQASAAGEVESFDSVLGQLHDDLENPRPQNTVSTQYIDLDTIMGGGFTPTNLVIVAARPRMGKSALAGNILLSMGLSGIPAGFFSLEMGSIQVVARMVSEAANIPHDRIRRRALTDNDWQALYQVSDSLQNLPVYIDDAPNRTIYDIRARARMMVRKYSIKALFVDYLTWIKPHKKAETRDQEVTEIAHQLKGLAKELNIPVIALAQLNRECEKRQNKRPILSDLRESGGIEQAADDILFLYRDEVYNKHEDNPNKGIAELNIAKQRNGPEGTVKLAFSGPTMCFRNLSMRGSEYEQGH